MHGKSISVEQRREQCTFASREVSGFFAGKSQELHIKVSLVQIHIFLNLGSFWICYFIHQTCTRYYSMKCLKKDKEKYSKQRFLSSGEVMVNLTHHALNTRYRCETQGQIPEPSHTSLFLPVNPAESHQVSCED